MKIRLKNFRSFRDTGWVELKPLMILAGANSSGKSSFLRFFPLMKQTLMQPSGSPLLWFGNLVDFGSFSEAVSRGSKPKQMELRFKFELEKGEFSRYPFPRHPRESGFSGPLELACTLAESKEKGGTVLTKLELAILNFNVRLDWKNEYWSVTIERDSSTLPESDVCFVTRQRFADSNQFLLPFLCLAFLDPLHGQAPISEDDDPTYVYEALFKRYPRFSIVQSEYLAGHLQFDSVAGILAQWNAVTSEGLRPTIPKFPEDNEDLQEIQQLLLLQAIPQIVSLLRVKLQRIAQSLQYIGPFRATPERFYLRQELNVGQIDAHGENLAMYLDSLSSRDFNSFTDFAEQHLGHKLALDRSASHVQIQLVDSQGHKSNLVDMGYGFSQVLPIVAQAWHSTSRDQKQLRRRRVRMDPPNSLVCIEQPELHLHPELQSYLADMFVAALRTSQETHALRSGSRPLPPSSSDPPISFLIETHSEALLARLGAMVEVGKVSSDDISVLLFEKEEDTGITSVRPAIFNARGELENWPIGFFAPSLRD